MSEKIIQASILGAPALGRETRSTITQNPLTICEASREPFCATWVKRPILAAACAPMPLGYRGLSSLA
jgi:hypothetical protein